MHPILGSIRRIVLYGLAWQLPMALTAFLLAQASSLRWIEALFLSFPLYLLYGLICLSPWYSCRFLPLRTGSIAKALANHTLAALIASGIWIGVARALAELFGKPFPGLTQRITSSLPILFGVGVMLYVLAVAMHYVYLSIQTSHEALQREHVAKVLAREAELKALKAQINPHFLFNCLHSISALTAVDPPQAREMCIRLSDFLRNTLRLGERTSIPFGEELSLVRTYLNVEQVRFGARLRVEQNIDVSCESCQVPPLLLQPLVENAVKHGIAGLVEGGVIRIDAACSDGYLRVVVENNFDPDNPAPRKSGMGLTNVRSRIAARHGGRGLLQVQTKNNCHRVELALPCGSIHQMESEAASKETT